MRSYKAVCPCFSICMNTVNVSLLPEEYLPTDRFIPIRSDRQIHEYHVVVTESRHRLTLSNQRWTICDDDIECVRSSCWEVDNLTKSYICQSLRYVSLRDFLY